MWLFSFQVKRKNQWLLHTMFWSYVRLGLLWLLYQISRVSLHHCLRPLHRPVHHPLHCRQHCLHGSGSSWYGSGHGSNSSEWKLCKIQMWLGEILENIKTFPIFGPLLILKAILLSFIVSRFWKLPICSIFSFLLLLLPWRQSWRWWQWVQNIISKKAGIFLTSSLSLCPSWSWDWTTFQASPSSDHSDWSVSSIFDSEFAS